MEQIEASKSNLTLKPQVPVASLCVVGAFIALVCAAAHFVLSHNWLYTLAVTSTWVAMVALGLTALYFRDRKRVFFFYTNRFSIWNNARCTFEIDYENILKARWYNEGVVLQYGSIEPKQVSLNLGREQTRQLYRFWKGWHPQLTEGITELARNALGLEE